MVRGACWWPGMDVGGTDLGSVVLTGNVELSGAQKATPHEPHRDERPRADGRVGRVRRRRGQMGAEACRGRGGAWRCRG